MERTGHSNWLDQFRLLFATAVVYSHVMEQVGDGRWAWVYRNCTVGELAVLGFFTISGYLISEAWLKSRSAAAYLQNRALRIIPGFVAASAISVLVVGPIGAPDAGVYWSAIDWSRFFTDIVTITKPHAPPSFAFMQPNNVNGPLWTIQAEIACYLLVPFMLLRREGLVLAWVAVAAIDLSVNSPHMRALLLFLSGAAFQQFQPRRALWAMVAGVAVMASTLWAPRFWCLGVATGGAYTVLSLGLSANRRRLPADVSYGMYLYGWPAQKLLMLAGLASPWLLLPASILAAGACGVASWFGLERHAMRLKARAFSKPHAIAPSVA